jgi:hypothetical protein
MSVLLGACATAQAPQRTTTAPAAEAEQQAAKAPAAQTTDARTAEAAPAPAAPAPREGAAKAPTASETKAKTASGAPGCTPVANAAPKVVSGESSASDSAETGQALVFDVAGIALEIPACTPEADVRVITVSWETKDRPNATHIHPNFTRHAATLRVDQDIAGLEGAPLQVRLHSKRELTKPGEKLVLAVESSGECDAEHKRDKLEDGDCSHWQLFDAPFDAQRNEMVARIPGTGGYRLQFGWVPSK